MQNCLKVALSIVLSFTLLQTVILKDAKADSDKRLAERLAALLTRKERAPDIQVLNRALKGSGFEVVEALGTSVRIKASKSSKAKISEMINSSKHPCKVIHRAVRRAELRGDTTTGILFKLSDCDSNDVVHAELTSNEMTLRSYPNLNGAAGVRAPGAWDITTGRNEVIVGIIDTGVLYTHPDLNGNMWRNPRETANGIDDDANGYVDDIYGINAITNTGNPLDDNGHGTHVAGTIGGYGNNGVGVVGVAWRVKMIACKFLSSSGSGYTSDALKCIDYFKGLAQAGVKLMATNNSWGGGGYSAAIYNAIEQHRAPGITFVAAAGNNNQNIDSSPSYPAAYNNVNIISVAACGDDGRKASFSNYGTTNVDICAPGVNIYSTYLNNGYASLSGTSMAAPHVTGILALMKAANLKFNRTTNQNVLRTRILSSALVAPVLNGIVAGNKRVSAAAAVSAASAQ